MKISRAEPIEVRTNDGWVVSLRHSLYNDTVELWIGQEIQGRFYLASVTKDGYLTMKEIKDGAMEETPTIRLNAVVWEAFAEAIRGVLPPAIDKKEVDAELKASKYHLEDMRKLVFNRKLK